MLGSPWGHPKTSLTNEFHQKYNSSLIPAFLYQSTSTLANGTHNPFAQGSSTLVGPLYIQSLSIFSVLGILSFLRYVDIEIATLLLFISVRIEVGQIESLIVQYATLVLIFSLRVNL